MRKKTSTSPKRYQSDEPGSQNPALYQPEAQARVRKWEGEKVRKCKNQPEPLTCDGRGHVPLRPSRVACQGAAQARVRTKAEKWTNAVIKVLVLCVVPAHIARADEPIVSGPVARATNSAPVASRPSTQPISFQPGIRINFKDRCIEVDATVILRQGGIELFACSPQTREHESIVCIKARPLHLYQALGLIGLTPGHPVRYDPETESLKPATGDPVEVYVRYARDGIVHTEPIEHWMKAVQVDDRTGQPPKIDRLPWVFAGSIRTEDGMFAADNEGTVVAVVNFDSSLIALDELHSDRNSELWLEPETKRIPPEQTPCTLIIKPCPLRVILDAKGRVWLAGRSVTLATVANTIRKIISEGGDCRIQVKIDSKCPPASQQPLLQLLKTLQVPEENIIIIQTPTSSEARHDSRKIMHQLVEESSPVHR